jgi:hypothetical protein
MAKPPTNIAASVRTRLLNLARRTNQPFDVLLTRFVHERLLYRLSRSRQADRFVLKGAMLLTIWLPETARGTRDLALLGFGDASERRILGIFRGVLAIADDDGVTFDLDALAGRPHPRGVRVWRRPPARHCIALRRTHCGRRRYRLRRFHGAGPRDDRLSHAARPSGAEAARLCPETVIAEKFQAMVALGRATAG